MKTLSQQLSACNLCPRRCNVNRWEGEIGYCRMGKEIVISSFGAHMGEEAPLVGRRGSGTVFLTGCNLLCVFCQNGEISHLREGRKREIEDLVSIMLSLEERGCHNINFVTPTHFTPHIREAILRARRKGLEVPIVYNCGGYESTETLRSLEGMIEIYMPDMKFSRREDGAKYCNAPDYPDVMKAAVKEMHRQVGDLAITGGLAVKGLLVRHLVMPGGAESGKEIVDFLAGEISSNTYINVMGQFHPAFRSAEYPELAKGVSLEEVREVLLYAVERGLRLDKG